MSKIKSFLQLYSAYENSLDIDSLTSGFSKYDHNDYSKDIHLTKKERKGKTYQEIQVLRKQKAEEIKNE
jgi:hypothetical protein